MKTKTEVKHTSTPLSLRLYDTITGKSVDADIHDVNGQIIVSEVSMKWAELIVLAVNSYEPLHEANKSLSDEIGKQLKEKLALRETNAALLEAAKAMQSEIRRRVGFTATAWDDAIAQAEAGL